MDNSIRNLIIVAILVGAQLTGATSSYFSDSAMMESSSFETQVLPSPSPSLNMEKMVINEVYYDVADDGTTGTENENEWIELYNNSDTEINLKDWSQTDEGEYLDL